MDQTRKKVNLSSTFYWKYISIWVDPSQFEIVSRNQLEQKLLLERRHEALSIH